MADVATPVATAAAHDHEHAHSPFLAHHFDTPVQQFDAGKLGMWLFLATEILLFGGLFCAYAIYRRNHPEVFQYAHKVLDTNWGAINTVVLLVSSFTMAWAVHAAQRSQRSRLVLLLGLTFLGGVGFMVIKAIEYRDKFAHGALWGVNFDAEKVAHTVALHDGGHAPAAAGDSPTHSPGVSGAFTDPGGGHNSAGAQGAVMPAGGSTGGGDTHRAADPSQVTGHPAEAGVRPPEHGAGPAAAVPASGASAQPPAFPAPAPALAPVKLADGQAPFETSAVLLAAPPAPGLVHEHAHSDAPNNVHWFFGIYFAMTGLHGLHVLAGMAVIGWLFFRAVRGDFSADYFTPVDLGGLYWHLVDLIWIYLFPLLYLIH